MNWYAKNAMSKAGKEYPIIPIKIWVIIYIGCLGQIILEISYIKIVTSYYGNN